MHDVPVSLWFSLFCGLCDQTSYTTLVYICVFPGLVVYFWAPSVHQPRAALQYIKVCSVLLFEYGCWYICVLTRLPRVAGSRKPPFIIFQSVADGLAAYGRRPKAPFQCIQGLYFALFAAYGGRPKAAFQYIQVCS